MLHGFPGNEKNLDLAYSIRRAGWNVLVPFYRGAWGSGGTFSVTHTLEDAQTSIDFLRDAENAKKFRIDPNHIVLVGHSMGGFVAAYASATFPSTNERMRDVWTFVCITCPIAIAGMHHAISLYEPLAANAVTYALVGLTVEIFRRPLHHAQ
jgi:pimeloyl-ACP methyl ester carboxylesterase